MNDGDLDELVEIFRSVFVVSTDGIFEVSARENSIEDGNQNQQHKDGSPACPKSRA